METITQNMQESIAPLAIAAIENTEHSRPILSARNAFLGIGVAPFRMIASTGGPLPREIATGIANLAARRDDLGDWTTRLPARPSVNFKQPKTYGSEDWQKRVRRTLAHHFGGGERAPVFVAGAIASSDRLVKDPKLLFPWIETARDLLAVEMESAGVYRAVGDQRTLMLAIRGVSDIVGLERDDRWTKYACATAAAFTRAYLRTTPVPSGNSSSRLTRPPDGRS